MGGGWWLGKEISHSTEEKGLYQHRIMEPRLGQTLVERTEFNRSLMLIACDAKSLSLFPKQLSLRDQTVSDQPMHSQKRIWLSASFQHVFFFFSTGYMASVSMNGTKICCKNFTREPL